MDRDDTGLEWLPQRVEYGGPKLGGFSKEWKVHLNRCSHSSRQRLRTWLISRRIRIKRDQMEA
jgi:hypothetical protein